MIKAIYNLWWSNYFVKLVTEMLQLKVRYKNIYKDHDAFRNLHELSIMIFKLIPLYLVTRSAERRV